MEDQRDVGSFVLKRKRNNEPNRIVMIRDCIWGKGSEGSRAGNLEEAQMQREIRTARETKTLPP